MKRLLFLSSHGNLIKYLFLFLLLPLFCCGCDETLDMVGGVLLFLLVIGWVGMIIEKIVEGAGPEGTGAIITFLIIGIIVLLFILHGRGIF